MPSPNDNGVSYVLTNRAPGLARYPHARAAGGLIYVSGVSSRRPDNTWEGVTETPDGKFILDIRAQTRAVIQNIQAILKAAGANLKNLVDLTVFLVDMADYAAFNEVYNEFFDAETGHTSVLGPTRTTVAVKELPNPRLLIEIKAVALDPKR
ncbi:hypothetical protein HK104_001441 [Borealophlyctis nickersoniae]|nr:hypothetical protein HK104_001441 [Borealophlyctis nickersoniae]